MAESETPLGQRAPARSDVASLVGYHSPQVDVDVRLNTNEAAEPPPPGFMSDLRQALAGIDLNRYPDRGADRLRAAPASSAWRRSNLDKAQSTRTCTSVLGTTTPCQARKKIQMLLGVT